MSAQYPQITIPGTEVHMISSSNVDQQFKISVALPLKYAESDKTYPALYVLDANGYLGTAIEIVRLLPLYQELPEMVVIGIGYPVDGLMETAAVRIRDYTPTVNDDWYDKTVKEAFPEAPEYVGSGGAAAFLQFVREELMPLIDSNYRTDPGNQTVVGHSGGGLFALYTLLHHPDTFNRYVIGSPSIWWDKGVTFQYEKDFAANNSDLAAKVFMAVGALEEPEKTPNAAAMVTNMKKLAEILQNRGYASLEMKTHVFEDETHLSVVSITISRGLRMVFE